MAKSPISPPLVFPFNITSSGISLLTDAGVEMTGPQINTIQNQGLFLTFLTASILSWVVFMHHACENTEKLTPETKM